MPRKKGNAFSSLCNCIGMIGENRKRAYWNEIIKEAETEKAIYTGDSAIAPLYVSDKPYIFPQVDKPGFMLYHLNWGCENVSGEANAILNVLNSFGIHCTLVNINRGVRFNQYVIEPGVGTKVQSIMKLEKEFQVALHCNAVLSFDNGYVLVEVPSGTENLYLGDMLIDDKYKNASGYPMAIGMAVDGTKYYMDISEACHILISGMTGSGKSIMLHNLIISLLMKKNPVQMHLYIIDPKATEFGYYKSLAICSVITKVNDAVELLNNLCIEMEHRYSILKSAGCRDIESYNKKFADKPMRRDIVFIDELSDLMGMGGKSVEEHIVRIAQKARACGIHLILATQYPVAKVVTGLIKANMPTKICLRVGTVTNSMVALDMPGGEKLMGHGDMLFLSNGSLRPIRLQCGMVSETAINNVVFELMKNQQVCENL